jgi:hypothetical protein
MGHEEFMVLPIMANNHQSLLISKPWTEHIMTAIGGGPKCSSDRRSMPGQGVLAKAKFCRSESEVNRREGLFPNFAASIPPN